MAEQDFVNLRLDPKNGSFNSVRVKDTQPFEFHRVQEFENFPGQFGIQLNHRPSNLEAEPIKVYLVDTSGVVDTASFEFTNITGDSNPNTSQANIDYVAGYIFVHSDYDQEYLAVDYYSRGTNFSVRRIQELIQTFITSITDTFDTIFVNTIKARTSSGISVKNDADEEIVLFDGGSNKSASFRGNVIVDNHVRTSDGTDANPGYAFKDEHSSGFWRIAAGRIGKAILGVKVGEFNSNGWQGLDNVLTFKDSKAANTGGGTFTAGDWRTRTISAVTNRISGSAVSSNQITGLPAGTYRISVSCPAYDVRSHQMRVRDITGNVTLLTGSSEFASDASDVANDSKIIEQEFTLSVTSTIEIQHRCENTKADNGFGFACNFGENVVYTQGILRRLA